MSAVDKRPASGWRVGVDIGGTFTDVILMRPGSAPVALKVLSTPPDFERGVLEAIGRVLLHAGIAACELDSILHGTTVATNAILESRGARTAMVATRGFRDVLEIGRLRRPYLYDITWEKPRPLVPRRRRFGLNQRITSRGELEPSATPNDIDSVVAKLREARAESVAVCLVNSYLRPDEERRIAAALREKMPGVFVSASVDVSPEMREYERMSTTVVNAYVGPIVGAYLTRMRKALGASGASGSLQIMQSSGGLLSADRVAARPVQLIESGPAAGVIGVEKLASALGMPNVIAFDMGGTTAKASLIEDGKPFIAQSFEVGGGMNLQRGLSQGAGYLVRVPSIDIAEVGAGGGSLIWVDDGGAVRVGPESAGASPGPACYGNGGTRATLTDANVVLGYLNPVALAGGNVSIRARLAHEVIENVSAAVGMDSVKLAFGAYLIAATSMTKAVKAVTSERGRDPRDSVLIAFGGAGPIYAAAMARELGIARIVVPVHPGLFSALGLQVADVEREEVAAASAKADAASFQEQFETLDKAARAELAAQPGDITVERLADMRYHGQRFELRIPVPSGPFDEGSFSQLRSRFHDEHDRTYGRRAPDSLVEVVNLRVRAFIPNKARVLEVFGRDGHADLSPPQASRRCYFGNAGFVDARVMSRDQIQAAPMTGPLIIEDMDATTVVPPDADCHRDESGNVVITLIEGRMAR